MRTFIHAQEHTHEQTACCVFQAVVQLRCFVSVLSSKPKTMETSQETLRTLWKGGQQDRLSPWGQALALAYREASKDLTKSGKANVAWVAKKVVRVDGKSPSPMSLHEFFAKVDADPDWFPGKHNGKKRGPAPLLTPAKRRAVATCAMRIKARGDEVTVEEVIHRCAVSTTNPSTGKPFDAKKIRDIFSTECYDLDPENPWRYQTKSSRLFLPREVMEHRVAMSKELLAMPCFTPTWFLHNAVWIDPCSSILPGSLKQYLRMKEALKGDKGWHSDDAKHLNENRRGPPTALKQKTWDGTKVNWVIILSRGVIGVDILPLDWQLDGNGMATVVHRLKDRLREMLGPSARLPKVIMSDRGTGMYAPAGQVVHAYEHAVRQCGFKLFWGPDAKRQAPDMPDLLLHETAVSWVRNVLRRMKPEVLPWKESPAQWSRRMMRAIDEANQYDVEALCMDFPDRIQECLTADGAKLSY